MTKNQEDLKKCNFWQINGGAILQYIMRVDWGRTTPQSQNDTFTDKYPILILQGRYSMNKYWETKTWDL